MKWYQQMTKWLTGVAMVFAIVTVSIAAFAQIAAPPETVDGATSLVPKLIEALVAGNHSVAGGIVLMVLMVAVRQFVVPKWKLPTELLPIVTALIGAISMVGLSMTNNVSAVEAAKTGLVIALFAGGTWSLIGKYIAKKILGEKYAEPQV